MSSYAYAHFYTKSFRFIYGLAWLPIKYDTGWLRAVESNLTGFVVVEIVPLPNISDVSARKMTEEKNVSFRLKEKKILLKTEIYRRPGSFRRTWCQGASRGVWWRKCFLTMQLYIYIFVICMNGLGNTWTYYVWLLLSFDQDWSGHT